jgi:hypothetical protein
MRDDYKKERVLRPVHFNPRNPVHLQILRFIDQKEVNYSELVRHLLFTYIMTHPETQRLSTIPSPPVKRSRKRRSKPTLVPQEHSQIVPQVDELPIKTNYTSSVSNHSVTKNEPAKKEKQGHDDFGGLPIDF